MTIFTALAKDYTGGGTFANRPDATVLGPTIAVGMSAYYFATDTGKLYSLASGDTAWQNVIAGSVANALTAGTGLSGSTYNGSAAVTWNLGSAYGDTTNPYASKTANFFLAAPNGSSGVPSFRSIVTADVPTLNQNTTGSAATLTTARGIYGNNFDGSASLTQVITSVYGGTGNGFTKFSGPTTSEKTFTLPNASANVLTDNAAVTIAQGGTNATTAGGALTNLGAVNIAGDTMTGLLNVNVGAGTFPSFIPNDGLRQYRSAASTMRLASDGAASFAAYRFSSDATAPGNAFVKGRGSMASPSAPIRNDVLGQVTVFGVNAAGTGIIGSGSFNFSLTDPSVSDSNRGTTFTVAVAPNSSTTSQTVLSINNETGLSTNGAVTIDQNRLHVLRQYTVATLPAAGTAGRMAAVTDATAPTYLGALTGGGTVKCPVYDNGTAWVSC